MQKLSRSDLMSLEQYSLERTRLRNEVIAHKPAAQRPGRPNMTWCFEDRTTIRYQVLEMLRAERIFESAGIQDEARCVQPTDPKRQQLEGDSAARIPDPEQRRVALGNLIGVEDRCWMRVSEMDRVSAIADEDLERENADKTSAVHFLRFELTPSMVQAMKGGATLSIGVDHEHYRHSVSPLPDAIRNALAGDLD